jgi:AraC-like DNA-binding protein
MTRKKHNRAKHFLGVFMVVAFLLYFSHAIFFKQYLEIYVYVEPIYIMSSLMVYPLYYWYIKLLTVEVSINHKNLWMMAPGVFFGLITAGLYFFMESEEQLAYVKHHLFQENSGINESSVFKLQRYVYLASRLVFAIQVFTFLVLGSRLVLHYNKRIANFYSNLESKNISWVNLLLVSFVVTSLMSIVFNIIGKAYFLDHASLLLIPSAIFSTLLFLIGIQGYLQDHTVVDLEIDEFQKIDVSDIRKYNSELLKDHLLEVFSKDEIYKQADLKITQISAVLKTNRTYISNLINNEFSCTFNEFVNQYRLKEAKRLLVDDVSKAYSLDYIGEQCGFGSLSTFIRVFKDSEGITPGRYRDKNRMNTEKKEG